MRRLSDLGGPTFYGRLPALTMAVVLVLPATGRGNPEDDELARLRTGEMAVQTVHEDKAGGAARVRAYFHATPDEVWNVIGYCRNEFIYVNGLKHCELVEPGLFHKVVHHRVKSSWYTPTLDFTFEANRVSATRGEFRLVGGDLKVMEGYWQMQPVGDGEAVVVEHEIRIRSQMPAPRWLVRRVLRKDLPDMMACVRGLADASGDDRRVAEDLARCPGEPVSAAK